MKNIYVVAGVGAIIGFLIYKNPSISTQIAPTLPSSQIAGGIAGIALCVYTRTWIGGFVGAAAATLTVIAANGATS